MRLKPFFSYYGSKYTIIEKYPKPETETIIAPFAGSAQYATRYPHKKVILYDLDDNIFQVWNYLINVSEREIMSMDLNFENIDQSTLSQEQKILCGFWIAQSGARPAKKRSPRSKENDINWKKRVSSQLKHIRHWKIYNMSYDQIPDYVGTWFIDPPYTEKGHRYRQSSKNIDYDNLREWSLERRDYHIVCENFGANWMDFSPICTLKSSKNKQATEVIFTNIPKRQLSLFEETK